MKIAPCTGAHLIKLRVYMKLRKLLDGLSNKETWARVAELNRIGFFKDKEKRILFGAPLPHEYRLPLRTSIVLGVMIVIITIIIAAGIFIMPVNIILGVLIIALIFMPVILKGSLKSK